MGEIEIQPPPPVRRGFLVACICIMMMMTGVMCSNIPSIRLIYNDGSVLSWECGATSRFCFERTLYIKKFIVQYQIMEILGGIFTGYAMNFMGPKLCSVFGLITHFFGLGTFGLANTDNVQRFAWLSGAAIPLVMTSTYSLNRMYSPKYQSLVATIVLGCTEFSSFVFPFMRYLLRLCIDDMIDTSDPSREPEKTLKIFQLSLYNVTTILSGITFVWVLIASVLVPPIPYFRKKMDEDLGRDTDSDECETVVSDAAPVFTDCSTKMLPFKSQMVHRKMILYGLLYLASVWRSAVLQNSGVDILLSRRFGVEQIENVGILWGPGAFVMTLVSVHIRRRLGSLNTLCILQLFLLIISVLSYIFSWVSLPLVLLICLSRGPITHAHYSFLADHFGLENHTAMTGGLDFLSLFVVGSQLISDKRLLNSGSFVPAHIQVVGVSVVIGVGTLVLGALFWAGNNKNDDIANLEETKPLNV